MEKNNGAHIAVPGEILGTEEEFMPGSGTYTDKEGNIRAMNAGIVIIDEQRMISVVSDRQPEKLKSGDVVYGRVEEMFESVAFLTIEHPNSADTERVDRMSAVIPVSEIKEGYVKSIRDELRVGDIVIGAVKEITPLRVVVSLKPKGMGVVMAYCSYDRKPMVLKGRTLVCSQCNQKEERHIAENYGKFEYVESAEFTSEPRSKFQRNDRIPRRKFAGRRAQRLGFGFQGRRQFQQRRSRF
ncbi:MAG: exosome complex RNA-binding protein Csl4 [Candidatus Micrarchaeota archaeon]|nr:exosome complex RNA-binding protein Csl4 [Candidatus Micrarchaeota archaeon]